MLKQFQNYISNVKLLLFCRIQKLKYSKLQATVRTAERLYDIAKIRNVGVIAHIDAGKTTTSERMLYYSGFSSIPGNIDDGNTVTDFMRQERERGISITSAVVSFAWKQHLINLIDTPGHIDFTSEVECALRVLDGAVLIIDASSGVEAQTLGVWKQALKYRIPQLAFVNKMDKRGACLASCARSIRNKLGMRPLVLQMPVYRVVRQEGSFEGVVDLVGMRKLLWQEGGEEYGRDYREERLEGGGELVEACAKGRQQLLEELANLDDSIGERYLEDSDLSELSEEEVWAGVARVTQACRGLPVMCGSSLRNKGVQPLLDAMVRCLPDPLHHDLLLHHKRPPSTPQELPLQQQPVIAFAFKTMHTRNKQPINFLRLHSGHIKPSAELYNYTSDAKEKVDKLLQIRADEYRQMAEVMPGMIFAATGFKNTKTGDILVSTNHHTSTHSTSHHTSTHSTPTTPESHSSTTPSHLSGIPLSKVPDPVYFCSIEPPTLAAQKGLDEALACLSREDPSLKVRVDGSTGQTVLGGMGQLHLEVIRDRIREEYKIDADLGELLIAYQESMRHERRVHMQVDKVINGSRNFVNAIATFYPVAPDDSDVHNSPLSVDSTLSFRPERKVNLVLSGEKQQKAHFSIKADVESDLFKGGLRPHLVKPIQEGLCSGFSKGPLLGHPVCRVHMQLNELQSSPKTSMAIISSCFSKLVAQALSAGNVSLLQPIMQVEVISPSEMLGTVLSDLSQRDSHIEEVQRSTGDDTVVVVARTPLANMADFSTALRTKTSGLASFNMSLSSYEGVSEQALVALLK